MKRSALILILGVVLGLCGYCGFYFAGTASHRALLDSEKPELEWLKKEFDLADFRFRWMPGSRRAVAA